MLPITDITKFTFQDFPEHTACIVWFGGCNFRCQYCHNPEFITGNFKTISENDVFKFLNSRIGLLEGVVLSGGECTLSNNLYDFVKKIKDLGFLVKIDTNGTNFELIEKLINDRLVDFIALDYKAPKNKFSLITNSSEYDKFEMTLKFLILSNINMEIRTTVHTDLIDEDDINKIINDLENKNYKNKYFIQNFRNDNNSILGNLSEQKKILDKNKIISKNIKINFRNFN